MCNIKCIKSWQNLIECTTSLSYHSFPNLSPSLIFSLTLDGTTWLSFIPLATSTSTSIERSVTKSKMLQSQSKSLATIANKLEASVKEWEALLKVKVNVAFKNNAHKTTNLKVSKECEVITNDDFKDEVRIC